jgi:surfeit locus 1 family protein
MTSPAKGFEFRLGRFRFRPTLGPTLFTIPALMVLLGLGTWQVERLQWKQALIAEREARVSAPAIAVPSDSDIAALEFRRVKVTGHFLHDREMYLAARSLNGNAGFHVVTPFMAEDGIMVLVDRGWIPLDRKDPATRVEGEVPGTVTIEGLIRQGGVPRWFLPDNSPGKNVWFYVDIAAMAVQSGISTARPFFIEAGAAKNPGGYPIGGQSRVELPNNHLQYALTWYSFALTLVVIYLIYHRVKQE